MPRRVRHSLFLADARADAPIGPVAAMPTFVCPIGDVPLAAVLGAVPARAHDLHAALPTFTLDDRLRPNLVAAGAATPISRSPARGARSRSNLGGVTVAAAPT